MTLEEASRQVKVTSDRLMRVLLRSLELGATKEGVAKVSDVWAKESNDTNQWVTNFVKSHRDVDQELVRNHVAEYVNILSVNMNIYADYMEKLHEKFEPGNDFLNADATKVMIRFGYHIFNNILGQRRALRADFRAATGRAALLAENERSKTEIYKDDDVYPLYKAKNYDAYVLLDQFCENLTRSLLDLRTCIEDVNSVNRMTDNPFFTEDVFSMAYGSFGMCGWGMYEIYRDISFIYRDIVGKDDVDSYLATFIRSHAAQVARATRTPEGFSVDDSFFSEADSIIRAISEISASDQRRLRTNIYNDLVITEAICKATNCDFVEGVKKEGKTIARLCSA